MGLREREIIEAIVEAPISPLENALFWVIIIFQIVRVGTSLAWVWVSAIAPEHRGRLNTGRARSPRSERR